MYDSDVWGSVVRKIHCAYVCKNLLVCRRNFPIEFVGRVYTGQIVEGMY